MPELLAAAVEAVGGAERPGQVRMAEAVAAAIRTGEHLAVQAGTGTGKSLGYLIPAIRHGIDRRATVVVSTATIALQRQLVERDLPRVAPALASLLGREPRFAILKGRRNYLCLHRLRVGAPDEPERPALFDAAPYGSRRGPSVDRQVRRLHAWAEETATGDRDDVVPAVGEAAWSQVAVSARECLGRDRCPSGAECFAERARAEAAKVDVVVTNHALLAIDALESYQVLPEHGVVVIDEAHELVDRVTSVATGELNTPLAVAAAHRSGRLADEGAADRLSAAGERLGTLLADLPPGRMDVLSEEVAATLAALREAAQACVAALGAERREDPAVAAARKAALAVLDEVHGTSVRLLGAFASDISDRPEVVWLDGGTAGTVAGARPQPATLRVAPLAVAGLLRERLFGRRTVVLTSATLTLGGSFDALARQWGLPPSPAEAPSGPGGGGPDRHVEGHVEGHVDGPGDGHRDADGDPPDEGDETPEVAWTGLDAGSPFDHPRRGILYVARHLPAPGRDGLPETYLAELAELVDAAGGRTLGLFSSMRAARQAADELRGRLRYPLLCQGDDMTGSLVRRFAEDERTCLFGTLSLWQGVDVPGPSLQLVVIDRIPFPRPDDPLASARQRAVSAHGGNGFMAVAATHAALLLAQGAGRLLRTAGDRGVVAVLDPRLATARYGGFLRASLPPFWATTDAAKVRAALRRIDAAPTPAGAAPSAPAR